MAITQRPATQEALTEPSGDHPLWKDVPSWFLIGEEDRIIPAWLQRYRRSRRERKAEMITTTTSTDPLVEAIATRLRLMDLVGWRRIATWAKQNELSFEDLRLLLALAVKIDDGPAAISELADLAGFSLEVAYPVIHRLRGRGYLCEEGRQYSLNEEGRELVAKLDAAHREGIHAYVDQLNPDERRQLEAAFGIAR